MEYWNFVTVRKDWKCWNRECGKDIKKGESCWSLAVNSWKNGDPLNTVRYCRDCGDPRKEDSKSFDIKKMQPPHLQAIARNILKFPKIDLPVTPGPYRSYRTIGND